MSTQKDTDSIVRGEERIYDIVTVVALDDQDAEFFVFVCYYTCLLCCEICMADTATSIIMIILNLNVMHLFSKVHMYLKNLYVINGMIERQTGHDTSGKCRLKYLSAMFILVSNIQQTFVVLCFYYEAAVSGCALITL